MLDFEICGNADIAAPVSDAAALLGIPFPAAHGAGERGGSDRSRPGSGAVIQHGRSASATTLACCMDARKRLALSRELELGDKTIACAGFDVGKKFVDIHSAGEDGSFEIDHSGHRAIAGFPRKHSASSVVIEATGRLHRGLRRSLDDRGFEVCVAYTRQARDFAGAAGRMATTDRVEGRIVKHVESDPEQLRLPHSFVDSGQRADRGRRAPRLRCPDPVSFFRPS
ncbi:MAG: hypothetical protein OXI01_09920 [Albidovulum sp.]|nr:hypothetical protein [Albidovulum sp.]